ncbi:MAG: hypothetical protein CM15mP103_10950 [Gammaproteobacteria bacterium]|nr:MAG: hypothetical protein CM15mP103_10950 [Gammaproteobacteria bacterium]
MGAFLDLLDGVLDAAMMLLALAILMALIAVVVLYVIDVTKKQPSDSQKLPGSSVDSAICSNIWASSSDSIFAMDREKLPFNRLSKPGWRAAKKLDSTIAFGSTKPLNRPGDIFFLNSAFPPPKMRSKRTSQCRRFSVGPCASPMLHPPFLIFQPCPTARCQAPQSRRFDGSRDKRRMAEYGRGGLSPSIRLQPAISCSKSAPRNRVCGTMTAIGTSKKITGLAQSTGKNV